MSASQGHGAYWAGIPCALDQRSLPRYVRARGLEASVSTLAFPASAFAASFLPLFDPARFDPLDKPVSPAGLGALLVSMPTKFQAIDRPPYRGDLVMATAVDGQITAFMARGLYLVDARVIDSESDVPLVEAQFADVRRWWDDFGEITRDWNVPLSGLPLPGRRNLVAGTAKPGSAGQIPVSLREIVQTLLDRLPGSLPIVRWPGETVLPETLMLGGVEVRAWAGRPKEGLRLLLDAFRLELDIGADLNARVFGTGEGARGSLAKPDDPDNVLAFPLEAFTAHGNSYTRRPAHESPSEVLIVGDRTIYDVQVDYMVPVITYPGFNPASGTVEERSAELTPANLSALLTGNLPGQTPAILLDQRAVGFMKLLADQQAIDNPSPAPPPDPKKEALELARMQEFISELPLSSDGQDTPTVQPAATAQAEAIARARAAEAIAQAKAIARALRPLPTSTQAQLGVLTPTIEPPATPPDASRALGGFVVSGKDGTGTGVLSDFVAPPELDPHIWQRLPFLEEHAWPLNLREISEEVRASLKRLWLVYEPQSSLHRLLPVRPRATTDPFGDRLPPLVEAFGFRVVRERVRDNKPLLERAKDVIDQQRAAEQLEQIYSEIARCRAKIDRLRAPTLGELLTLDDRSFGEGLLPGQNVIQAQDEENGALGRAFKRLAADMLGGLGDFGAGIAKQVGLEAELEAPEQISRLEAAIAEHEAAAQVLEDQLNPAAKPSRELAQAELAVSSEVSLTGQASVVTTAKRDAAQAALNAVLQARIDAASPNNLLRREEENATREVLRLVPLRRGSVPYRLLDAKRGRILLERPPVWPADLEVSSVDQTWAIPMPVRFTFGTANDQDFRGEIDLPGGAESFYGALVSKALAQRKELAALVGDLGSRLPRTVGEHQIRLSFSRDDPVGGGAPVGPFPWLVVIDDPRHPFQQLVRLGEITNRSELVARAQKIADALLGMPLDVETGALSVLGAIDVALNGRQSQVEIESNGTGFRTRISFDSRPTPVGDVVEIVERRRHPISFSFGLVPDDQEASA